MQARGRAARLDREGDVDAGVVAPGGGAGLRAHGHADGRGLQRGLGIHVDVLQHQQNLPADVLRRRRDA
jgi:hypothetical protein